MSQVLSGLAHLASSSHQAKSCSAPRSRDGFAARIEEGAGAAGEEISACRSTRQQRLFPGPRGREQPARPLDHHPDRLVDRRRDQSDPRPRRLARPAPDPFRPGPGLAEAAPGLEQPLPPPARRLPLAAMRLPRPELVEEALDRPGQPLEEAIEPRLVEPGEPPQQPDHVGLARPRPCPAHPPSP